MAEIDPIRPTDDEARAMARGLMDAARFAALAVVGPGGGPMVTRVGFGQAADGTPVTLVSDLAGHTRAMKADPRASLMVGEPGAKGDPLTHPRLTILAGARFVHQPSEERDGLAAAWLARHPKAGLYIDFPDFRFVRFEVSGAFLNGGFGRAFNLTPADLGLRDAP